MKRSTYFLIGLFLLDRPGLALADAPVGDRPQTVSSQFLRIRRDKQGQPLSLETSTTRYRSAKREGDITVDLVSVVHLGERHYYQKLNDLFEDYDVVLYELVADKGTRIPKGGRRATDNPVAMIQKIATTVLDLELQTDHIDYTRQNFIHADLSPSEMAEIVKKRGDDGMTLFLSIAADLLRQQNLKAQEPDRRPEKSLTEDAGDLLSLLTDSAAPSKLKRMMAEQLAELGSVEGALGKTLNTILITDRNRAAMKVLRKEVDGGKKKIAIFYGAGHMADFERKLRDELDLRPVSTQWYEAWDLRLRERGLEDVLLRFLVEQMTKRK